MVINYSLKKHKGEKNPSVSSKVHIMNLQQTEIIHQMRNFYHLMKSLQTLHLGTVAVLSHKDV